MPSVDKVVWPGKHSKDADARLFRGFAVPVSETVAELILQYVADAPVVGNVWQAMSLRKPPPKLSPSSGTLSSTSL